MCGCPGGVDINNFRGYRSNFQLVSSSEGENGAPLELQSLNYLFFAASESRKFECSFDEQIIKYKSVNINLKRKVVQFGKKIEVRNCFK